MRKVVKWFHLEEEFNIGIALIGDKEVFITEEAVRFDAPLLTVCETLKEAIDRKWFTGDFGFDDLEEEDQTCYLKELTDITVEYESTKRSILLHRFLKIMDDRFQDYVKDGIMESYTYKYDKCEMWISKEDYDIDHGYLWSALDGALILWNTQNKPYYIVCDEDAPDKDGMIRYSFEICKEGE